MGEFLTLQTPLIAVYVPPASIWVLVTTRTKVISAAAEAAMWETTVKRVSATYLKRPPLRMVLTERWSPTKGKIDGLVQERCNSSVLAMELRLSCTNPSKCTWFMKKYLKWDRCVLLMRFYYALYQQLSARQQYLKYVCNWDTAVLH